jgi:hypothetical protein
MKQLLRASIAFFDHTDWNAIPFANISWALGSATQDDARARDSSAASGNIQGTEGTSARLVRKECQRCSEANGQATSSDTFDLPE